jgi:hypothetical protein
MIMTYEKMLKANVNSLPLRGPSINYVRPFWKIFYFLSPLNNTISLMHWANSKATPLPLLFDLQNYGTAP